MSRRKMLALIAIPFLFAASAVSALDYVPGELVVRVPPTGSIESVNAQWGTETIEQISPRTYIVSVPVGVGEEDCDGWLDADSNNVESSDPNWITEAPEAKSAIIIVAIGSTDTQYEDQGAFARVGLQEAHQTATGEGIRIAILDTGIDLVHPAFQGKLLPGYDFVDEDADPSEFATGLDEDGDGLFDEGFGHGTMVAGIVAAAVPDARVIPVRVLDDEGTGTLASLIHGIDYAVLQGADVINMSVGLSIESEPLNDAIKDARDAGIVLVAAAGNANTTAPTYPASFDKVLSVTALDSNDVKAPFSTYNEEVDVAAPGDGIYSTYPGGTYARGSGTSFAAPFVSGAAALLYSVAVPSESSHLTEGLTDSVVFVDNLTGNTAFAGNLGGGRLDVAAALAGYVVETATSVRPGSLSGTTGGLSASPNPFRATTTIRPGAGGGEVFTGTLSIYSLQGRLVRQIQSSHPESGSWEWDGNDSRGLPVGAGIYLLRSDSPVSRQQGRLIHLR